MLKSDLKNVSKMRILGTEKSNHERKLAVIQISMKEIICFHLKSSVQKKREKVKLPLKRVILKETNSVNTTEYQNLKIIKTTMW